MSRTTPFSLHTVWVLLVGGAVLVGSVASGEARARQHPLGPRRAAHPRAEPAHRRILRERRQDRRSLSLGNTSTGRLFRGVALPFQGKHYAVLPRWRQRHTNFGTEALLTLLKHAAQVVAQAHRGSRLMVGNLSLRRGGDIRWSVSHNAGRDGDIAFYLRRGKRAVVPTALVRIDPHLRSLHPRGLRFDLPRNWTLVKALLRHKQIPVQWIFMARYLKAALLDHARALREPAALLARADKVLRQPTDSLSHNDHFHVRIYCSRRDRLEGCVDRAPFWPGVATWDRDVARRIRILVAGLQDRDANIRLEVLAYLVRLQASQAAPEVARYGLRDPDPRVRRSALDALAEWRVKAPVVLSALASLIQRPGGGVLRGDPRFERPTRARPDTARTGEHLRLAYAILGAVGSRQAVPLLRRALVSRRTILGVRGHRPVPEPLLAASAARSIVDLRLAPALIDALEHPVGSVRRKAAEALRRLTNHSFGIAWGRRLPRHRLQRLARRWRRWWGKHRGQSREELVRRGFRRINRGLRNLKTRRAQRVLVFYTRRPDHLGFNAHRMLRVLSGMRSTAPQPDNVALRYQRWRRWYQRRWRRQRHKRRPRRLRRIRRKARR